jgi:hypothetical protein
MNNGNKFKIMSGIIFFMPLQLAMDQLAFAG